MAWLTYVQLPILCSDGWFNQGVILMTKQKSPLEYLRVAPRFVSGLLYVALLIIASYALDGLQLSVLWAIAIGSLITAATYGTYVKLSQP